MVKVWSDLKMKRMNTMILAVAAVISAAPAAMGASVLGPAPGYSAFVFGNMTASSDTWGSVAVGGNATYSGGYNIKAATVGGNALVVGGNFSQNSSSINGNVVVGGTADYSNPSISGSLTAQNVGLTGGGSVSGGVKYYASYNPAISYIGGVPQSGTLTLPVNFSAAQTALTGLSNSLANSGPVQSASAQYGTLTLTGSSSVLDVFDITAALLSSVNTIDLAVTGSPTVVVNVNGAAPTIGGGTNGFQASNTIWNFYNATTLSVSGIQLPGTVLAPNASLTFSGQIDGSVIVDNYNGGGEIDPGQFAGTIPAGGPLPAPSTWALLFCGGLGLGGLALCRRKAADKYLA